MTPAPLKLIKVSQAKSWKPDAFSRQADEWQLAAQDLRSQMGAAASNVDGSNDYWASSSGDSMRTKFAEINTGTTKVIDALIAGAAAARGAASDIGSHRTTVVDKVTDAESNKYSVADDGTVSISQQLLDVLARSVKSQVSLNAAISALQRDAQQRTAALQTALNDLRSADLHAESAIREAFSNLPVAERPYPGGEKPTVEMPPTNASVELNRHWWNSLTPQQQQDIITNHPDTIGNRDGIPAEARDQANRVRLPRLLEQLENDQQTVAATYGTNSDEYKKVQTQINDLKAVDKAVNGPEAPANAKLMLLDTAGRRTRAAVAVGDPDKADHVSVTAPGVNTTVGESIEGMTKEAANLQQEAESQLRDKGKNETVATIGWIGYDTPQPRNFPSLEGIEGAGDTGTTARAEEGAAALSRFYNGLEAAHDGESPPHITAVGHSYGSLTTGLALQQAGGHPVTDMVVYGSPGIAARTPADLGLDPGHAFVMRADDDRISLAQDLPRVLLPTGNTQTDLTFGPDPAHNPNFRQLDTHAGFTADGRWLEGASGHSEYPQAGKNVAPDGSPVPRITGYNVAAVVAGLADHNAVPRR
ncbi:alpha/beta hydrolase [Nocardia sp. NPDC050710]|uniref:alpha/beta hydrolase n=1 Tax=Nocardia sp. NPDC050710 TaxID=3157220 RepID=UPI0033C2B5BC